MRQSVRLGRIAGIPVGLHWSVAVMGALIATILGRQVLPASAPHQPAAAYWLTACAGSLLFAAALLVHELGHSVAARRSGVVVRSITLWALGGVAELEDDPPSARADLRIAAAGPATSVGVGVFFGCLALLAGTGGGAGASLAAAVLSWLALMNGLLAAFNLLPGAPLDGGRVLRALLWMRHGDRARAARAAALAGRFVGAALALLGAADVILLREIGGLWLILIGLFLISAAGAEASSQAAAEALGGLRVRDVMLASPDTGAAWMTVTDFIAHVGLRSAQSVFPVIGPGGALEGVVLMSALSRVPLPDRPVTPLRRAALRVPPAYLADPDDPAKTLLTRPALAGQLAAVVIDGGQVVGIVTIEDLRQRIWRDRLSRQAASHSRQGLGRAA